MRVIFIGLRHCLRDDKIACGLSSTCKLHAFLNCLKVMYYVVRQGSDQNNGVHQAKDDAGG
jgi:hypothetical protein